ncbi:MAG: chemotaxis protein CheW [bacterium]|nr:chemotaxis protein CheW [bacterium]
MELAYPIIDLLIITLVPDSLNPSAGRKHLNSGRNHALTFEGILKMATKKWVIFRTADNQFAIDASVVTEMVALTEVSGMPDSPAVVRGTFLRRGEAIPVIDYRIYMGERSLDTERMELVDNLTAREEDHKRWIAELLACVDENREFKLATDPTKCAFGRWYDSFHSEDEIVSSMLKEFDYPHRQIHATAAKVLNLRTKGDLAGAREAIEFAKNTNLTKMIELFTEFKALLIERKKEILLVLQEGDRKTGVAVESISSVSDLNDDIIKEVDYGEHHEAIFGVGNVNSNMIFFLNHRLLFDLCKKGVMQA